MLTSSRHHIIYEAVQDQTALLFFQWLYRTNRTPDPPLGRRVAGCSPDGPPQYKPTECLDISRGIGWLSCFMVT